MVPPVIVIPRTGDESDDGVESDDSEESVAEKTVGWT